MGFKFKRVDLVAGSEEFPVGVNETIKPARSKTILTKVVEALISMNCGWTLDTTRSTSTTDYTLLPFDPYPNDSNYPALFLINSTSSCKLMISYFAVEPHWGIKDFSGNDILKVNSGSKHCASGLCMSMIPGGSSSDWGAVGVDFIPSDATRITSTHITSVDDSNVYCSFGGNPDSGYTYSWGIFATENCIAVSCAKSQTGPGNLGVPVMAVGRIYDSLSHSTDTTPQARYGSMLFRSSNTAVANSEGITSAVYDSYRLYNYDGSAHNFIGLSPNSNSSITHWASSGAICGSMSRADGTWINGTDESTYCITLYPVDVYQLSGYVHSSSQNGSTRWVPFAVRCVTSDLSTYGVIPGDGMKCYLDTDLFRCAIGTYGQQFDNGNFICIDGDYNFLIGWDPDNDPLVGE